MNDTPLDDLVTELESVDPADSPDKADAIALSLSDQLEAEDGDGSETPS